MCLICQRIELIWAGQNPYFVKELETGYVVLGDHQLFRGYSLFLCKYHVEDLHMLKKELRDQYLSEMADVSEAVARAFGAEKMNLESLENGDMHLHFHLFPRRAGDLGNYGQEGCGPVWWLPADMMYVESARPSKKDLQAMVCRLKKELL